MKLFRIKLGSSRFALIIDEKWVLKFPYFRAAFGHTGLDRFLRGIFANISEFVIYHLSGKPEFLVPVFSIGIVTFQPFEEGEEPDTHELCRLIRTLPANARMIEKMVSRHWLQSCNWKKNEKGYRLLDYGDAIGAFPLSLLLFQWSWALKKILCKTPLD